MVQNKRAIMRQNKSSRRNITTRSNRNRSRSPKAGSRKRGGRAESIQTRNFKSKRNINIQTKGYSEKKQQKHIQTKNGPPSSSARKRKLEVDRNFTSQSQSNKRAMREQRFKANTESAKKKALSTKAGNPDTKNKVGLFSLKSKPPPKKKVEPVVEVAEKKEAPVVVAPKPVVQPKKKAFVTLRTEYEASSSSEESESESESEERGLGPKLEVKAHDGALLLVRNLPRDVTTRDLLLELFHETPGIEQVSIHTDDHGISKGTADVAVSDVATARAVIKRCRKSVYRDHEIYVTLMGTSKVKTTASEVIAPMPKALRTKKEKRKKEETKR